VPSGLRATFTGAALFDTEHAVVVCETRHIALNYVLRDDAMTLLTKTAHSTGCPYRGTAHYHHIKTGGTTIDNAVWYYLAPLDEVRRIGDYLCFYPKKVDTILVDGK
jgi:uncharacterized protein (DUF427 family)